MDEQIYKFRQKDNGRTSIFLGDMELHLPSHLQVGGITKFRLNVENNIIKLERICNKCKEYFVVQIFDPTTNKFLNVDDSKIKMKNNSFNLTCIDCEKVSNAPEQSNINPKSTTFSDTTQLNIKVDKELKKYFHLYAVNNGSNLTNEVNNALIFYKNHIENDNKETSA